MKYEKKLEKANRMKSNTDENYLKVDDRAKKYL